MKNVSKIHVRLADIFLNFFFIISESKCSKWKIAYSEVDEQVEKFSKMIDYIMVKLTPIGLVMPKLIVCIFMHFALGTETDEFELPLPMW